MRLVIFVSLQSAASLTNFLRSGFPFPQSSSPQDYTDDMKVPPIQLPTGMDRLPLPLPFSPDLLWRYPNPFMAQPPPSPLESHIKSNLPGENSIKVKWHLSAMESQITYSDCSHGENGRAFQTSHTMMKRQISDTSNTDKVCLFYFHSSSNSIN